LPGDMLARLKRPRNSPHLLRVARNGDVLEGYVKHVAPGSASGRAGAALAVERGRGDSRARTT
jgi:hypothetical protein